MYPLWKDLISGISFSLIYQRQAGVPLKKIAGFLCILSLKCPQRLLSRDFSGQLAVLHLLQILKLFSHQAITRECFHCSKRVVDVMFAVRKMVLQVSWPYTELKLIQKQMKKYGLLTKVVIKCIFIRPNIISSRW